MPRLSSERFRNSSGRFVMFVAVRGGSSISGLAGFLFAVIE
jgi:hypothetical protein